MFSVHNILHPFYKNHWDIFLHLIYKKYSYKADILLNIDHMYQHCCILHKEKSKLNIKNQIHKFHQDKLQNKHLCKQIILHYIFCNKLKSIYIMCRVMNRLSIFQKSCLQMFLKDMNYNNSLNIHILLSKSSNNILKCKQHKDHSIYCIFLMHQDNILRDNL